MERRKGEGQNDGSAARIARALGVAAIAVFALGATGARAAEVAEVRVGIHEKSTRIVLELDRASGYRLVTPEDGAPELQIHLDAASVAREVPSKSPLVRKVRVEPSGSGSTVHVQLATSNVAVKELLLANPPRLVFDLTAQGPIPKMPAEEVAEAPEPPAAEEPSEITEAAPAPAPSEPIVIAEAAAPETKPEATAPRESDLAMPPPPVDPIVEPEIVPEAPAAAPIEVPTPVTREAVVPPAPRPVQPKPQSAQSDSIMDLATSPIGMGAIGAFVLAIGAILVMRRRRSAEDEDPLYTVMAADDAGAMSHVDVVEDREEPVRAAPIWEPDAYEASEPTPHAGPRQLALGARPAPEPEPEPEVEEIAPPDDSDSIFASEPEPEMAAIVAPMAMQTPAAAPMAASEETERRIAELERRIEQLAEARERLERQVAAQTEELRVQRAAIARTQRVVRSIAKTEDMATEPVPRSPSAS
jgi:hypothetical protein